MYMILSSSGFREIEDQFIFQGAKCPLDSLSPDTIKRRTPRIGPCAILYSTYLTLYSLRQTLCAGPKDFRPRESWSLLATYSFMIFLLLSIVSCFSIMWSWGEKISVGKWGRTLLGLSRREKERPGCNLCNIVYFKAIYENQFWLNHINYNVVLKLLTLSIEFKHLSLPWM